MAAAIQSALGQATDGVLGPKLPVRKLGRHGPAITALGYGLMGLSAFYGKPKPDSERFAILDRAYDAGELFWDSADIYGDNEDLLGKWFESNPGKRENIFLATKFANFVDEEGNRQVSSAPEYARKACEKSLARLKVKQIDLYYCHRVDKKTPIEKTVEELKKLQDEGKIRYIGLSEISSETLRRASKIVHIDAIQVEYSPFSLDIESPQIELLKTARELGTAIVAYSPIGRGMLGGQIRSPKDLEDGDFRKFSPRFSEENFPKNLVLVDRITELAKKKNVTASQLTLAWLLAQGDDVFPIPGTTNIARLEENLGALKVGISKEEEQEIRSAAEAAEPAGARYPEAMSAFLFGDTPPLTA